MNAQIQLLIALALAEDIGTGDLTAESVVPESATASGVMLLKQDGVISGLDTVAAVFKAVTVDDPNGNAGSSGCAPMTCAKALAAPSTPAMAECLKTSQSACEPPW